MHSVSKSQQSFVHTQSKTTPLGFGILWAMLASRSVSMSLLFDYMASDNPELEFRLIKQVMNADTQASTHCLFPSETSNDLEDGAQQSSHCRLGSQQMLPLFLRIKSKVLYEPLLYFHHLGPLLFKHSKPTPT